MKQSLSAALLLLAAAAVASAQVNVYISSPSQGSSASSPVHVTGMATAPHTISAMIVYIDNKEVYRQTTDGKYTLDTYVSLGGGSHSAYIKAWDTSGASGKSPTVSFSTSAAVGSSSAPDFYNIDEMTGWQVCTSCAGVVGVDDAPSSFSQYQASPSIDGKSMKFWIGGTTPYRNALWYKGLGPNSAQHFAYDLYFYITTPNYSEALEFDINQYINGRKYIFAHQCSPKWSHTWDTWNQSTGHWESTGISCPVFPAYRWNHVVLEVERTSDNQLHYVSITYNGVKSYVNRYRSSTGSSWNGVSVDFQMDGDYVQHDYSTWLDKVKLSSW